ncbi:MAG: sulfonate ABC transporter [Candidatus Caldarchaeales archaeon]
MRKLECPICGGMMSIPDDAISGELFEHDECGGQLELEIDEKGNYRLKEAEEIAEDWGE